MNAIISNILLLIVGVIIGFCIGGLYGLLRSYSYFKNSDENIKQKMIQAFSQIQKDTEDFGVSLAYCHFMEKAQKIIGLEL